MLEHSLFILNPTFRAALLHLRNACCDLWALRLHGLKPFKTYTLEEMQTNDNVHRQVRSGSTCTGSGLLTDLPGGDDMPGSGTFLLSVVWMVRILLQQFPIHGLLAHEETTAPQA